MIVRGRLAWALLAPVAALAAPARDLAELSLEELSDNEVTSVSRTEEPLADAAAAVAVVTNEDLRRSGATSIPEALRLVPGLHVAQLNSNLWAVNARGFSSSTSAKLLVLSDTRSIYTPLFSGVFWDVQDFLLEFDPTFVDPRSGQTILPIVNKNLTDGVSKGGEASLSFMPFRSWRAVANYTWTVVTVDPKGQDLNGGRFFAGLTPRHQIELQSFLDLPGRFQIDAFVRYATSLFYPRSVDPS